MLLRFLVLICNRIMRAPATGCGDELAPKVAVTQCAELISVEESISPVAVKANAPAVAARRPSAGWA